MSDLSNRIAALSPTQRALFERRLQGQGLNLPRALSRVPRRRASTDAPLSFAQERLWFLDQLTPGSPVYNGPSALRLTGLLHIGALKRGIDEVLRRHESLRTLFVTVEGHPVQRIASVVSVRLPICDLRALPAKTREAVALQLARLEVARPFDLARGPLLRALLLRLDRADHLLLITMHHIISDGRSTELLLQEIATLYEAFATGRPSPLPELPIQYADYVVWQRAWLHGPELEPLLAYWRATLAGAPQMLELPTDWPRPTVQHFDGAVLSFDLPDTLYVPLTALGRQENATLFMVLLAAFDVLLARLSGQEDLAVGSPIANRTRAELSDLIGFFANNLILRTDVSGRPGFRALVRRVREVALGAYSHQDVPFELLLQDLKPERTLSHAPLFQVAFNLQPVLMPTMERAGIVLRPLEIDTGTSKLDLSLFVWQAGVHLRGSIEYSAELFDATTIRRLARHFQTLLEGIAADPDARIAELPLLTRAEQRHLLIEWNDTRTGDRGQGTGDRTIQMLFEAQAARTPDTVALVFDDGTQDERRTTNDEGGRGGACPARTQHLTYGELNVRANQLAHHLRGLGVGPEVLVGMYMERSIELVIGVLGVLKAGGVYLPLDPAYPAERIAFMLEDSGATALVVATKGNSFGKETRRQGDKETDVASDVTLSPAHLVTLSRWTVDLRADWPLIARQPTNAPHAPVAPEHPAYVIYTSGSTGRPKGVPGPHRGFLNRAAWMWTAYPFAPGERCCQKTSFSFVDAVWEVFGPLLRGVPLVIIPAAILHDPHRLIGLLAREQITRTVLVPALLRALLEGAPDLGAALPSLRYWISSGEALAPDLARRFRERLPQQRLLNLYGASEVAADVLCYDTREGLARPTVAIGRPIANTQIYLLDTQMQPVPIGMRGEIYVGGMNLARGYLNRPDLTAERFVPNPFTEVSGIGYRVLGAESSDTRYPAPDTRLYKTGDLARYLPDGKIEYLGRADQQVKIRGFRVEPGEIAATLMRHGSVREAAVLARETTPGDIQLMAYIVQGSGIGSQGSVVPASGTLTPDPRTLIPEVRTFLRDRLPDYMVPAAFVLLDAFPLLPSGKLDRRALQTLGPVSLGPQGAYVAPRTPVEELVANIWAEVLGVERVGIDANFFALGGHSLLVTRVTSRIREALQVELPVRSLFEAPTVAGLAARIEAEGRTMPHLLAPPLLPTARGGSLPLSFAQQRIWFLDQLAPHSSAYNIPVVMRLAGPLDRQALARSIDALARRHEVLRTTFVVEHDQPAQRIAALPALTLPLLDLEALPETVRERLSRQIADAEAARPFALERGPLLRIALLQLSHAEHLLLLTMHHIIADGWSMRVLVEDLTALYARFLGGAHASLPELPIQYADFAIWQRQWLQGAVLEAHLDYWRARLAGAPALLELPTDRPRPPIQAFRGARERLALPQPLSDALKGLSRREGATLFMTLLAAFNIVLHRYSRRDDIIVGTLTANRNRIELERLIGFFANTLVLRTDLAGGPTFHELAKRVRETALDAYGYQDLPFEQLVEHLQSDRSLSYMPVVQVLFVLHNELDLAMEDLQLPGPLAARVRLSGENGTSKRDLSLHLTDAPGGVEGFLEYDSDLFDATTIMRMRRHLLVLLESIVLRAELPIASLPLLTQVERQQLLLEWNSSGDRGQGTGDRREQCIHELFEAQAARTPDAVAVVFRTMNDEERTMKDADGSFIVHRSSFIVQLSYAELDARANQLARHLRALNVGPEARVGIYMERSLEQMIAVLGVLKAGAAYLPLDPSYPPDRLAFMLEDARVPVLITTNDEGRTTNDESSHLVTLSPCHLVNLDADWSAIARQPTDAIESGATAGNLAYVIYTSGSTGRPKGAMITHASLCAYVRALSHALGVGSNDRYLHTASFGFSSSVRQLLLPLTQGATVVLAAIEQIADPLALFDQLVRHSVTIADLVPSYWHTCIHMLEQRAMGAQTARLDTNLRLALAASEPLPAELSRRWSAALGRRARTANMFGQTETTGIVSIWPLPDRPADRGPIVPIGRPVSGTQVYVLDRQLEPAPIGVPGELYIGGTSLARGYLSRPDLTAERFIPNPFGDCRLQIADCKLQSAICNLQSAIGTRLYRTGDLVRWGPDGALIFIGRADQQIKLRGVRIELGEIEAALASHPTVRECAVLVRERRSGDARLVAYIVQGSGVRSQGSEDRASETLTPDPRSLIPELRAYLAERLPGYMIPAAFVTLDALPLTSSGKLDRRALPGPDDPRSKPAAASIRPATQVEQDIASVWQAILRVEELSIHDTFFELGGTSLLIVQMRNRLSETLGYEVSVVDLFRYPTISSLAAHLGRTQPVRPSFAKVRARAEKQLARRQRRAIAKES